MNALDDVPWTGKQRGEPDAAAPTAPAADGLADLERRVQALETERQEQGEVVVRYEHGRYQVYWCGAPHGSAYVNRLIAEMDAAECRTAPARIRASWVRHVTRGTA